MDRDDVKELLLTDTRVSAHCVALMAGAEVRGVCVVTVLLTSSVVDGALVDVCNKTTPQINNQLTTGENCYTTELLTS